MALSRPIVVVAVVGGLIGLALAAWGTGDIRALAPLLLAPPVGLYARAWSGVSWERAGVMTILAGVMLSLWIFPDLLGWIANPILGSTLTHAWTDDAVSRAVTVVMVGVAAIALWGPENWGGGDIIGGTLAILSMWIVRTFLGV